MENQNPRVPPLWEHSLTTLLGHDPTSNPGIAMGTLPRCTQHLGPTQLGPRGTQSCSCQIYSLDVHGQGFYIRTNQIKQMYGLITYMKHIFGAYNSDIDPWADPFHPSTPDEWSQ